MPFDNAITESKEFKKVISIKNTYKLAKKFKIKGEFFSPYKRYKIAREISKFEESLIDIIFSEVENINIDTDNIISIFENNCQHINHNGDSIDKLKSIINYFLILPKIKKLIIDYRLKLTKNKSYEDVKKEYETDVDLLKKVFDKAKKEYDDNDKNYSQKEQYVKTAEERIDAIIDSCSGNLTDDQRGEEEECVHH
ncbi:MAG: hypothetical protein NC213_05045 [Acetobacter sp.]|nr:hypothetical protein [Bacteroides sp.]MCM1341092.1 hypothetical protein [Acetobacter sp.]MCM1433575.1 hypothetical protein [Clostridiales bacterium]